MTYTWVYIYIILLCNTYYAGCFIKKIIDWDVDMTETIWSRLMKVNGPNVEQHKNYSSKFEWKIQIYVDLIADFKGVQFAIYMRLAIFLGGYVKWLVYVPPLPAKLQELKQRITTALQTVTQDMLQRVLKSTYLWIFIQIWRNNSNIVQHWVCLV